MSPTTPPHSSSASVKPDEAQSTPHTPKTPKRPSHVSHLAPGSTPYSRGVARRARQESNADETDKLGRADYDEYLREDMERRVFVDFEVFMQRVLHVPENWKELWGPAIEAIKADTKFRKHHREYCDRCSQPGSLERTFYDPLEKTTNAVLDVLSGSTYKDISSEVTQCYRASDRNKLRGGVFNSGKLSPDLVVLHKECQPSKEEHLHWANALHVLEVKPFDNALCDGENMPRLVVDGVDPNSNHAKPLNPPRYGARKSSTPVTGSESASSLSTSRKRSAGGPPPTGQLPTKKAKTNSVHNRAVAGGASTKAEEGSGSSTPKPESQRQNIVALQVCRYLLEMFSVPLLRSHATASLVGRDRLQLYHVNRSVILVSSAIKFSAGDGLDKFIATIIAFHRLSLDQNGVLDSLVEGNSGLVRNSGILEDDKVVQKGNRLEFVDDEKEKFVVTLGDVISRDPAVVGRSTVVLEATSDRWPKTELVVKISWPVSNRIRETDFLKEAKDEAERTDGQWATKHLPRVFYATDVNFGKDSTLESVARLFDDPKFFDGDYEYERRTLRIIVQERLYPLKSLTNVKDIGQAILDVACIHRWLYDVPGILHRDLSLNNMMCRWIVETNAEGKEEQKVYGVLTDYDLSSRKKDLKSDYTRTSQQRTGTPPYMAQELLRGKITTHLYRHDVESLFYIMLLLGARHTIAPAKGRSDTGAKPQVIMRNDALPYQEWFNTPGYEILGRAKKDFFEDRIIELSPAFEDFRPWLKSLCFDFSIGFAAKNSYKLFQEKQPSWKTKQAGGFAGGVTSVPFDDETLGGRVGYSTVIEPARHLEGRLEGLIIRYDPSPPPLPSGAVHLDA